MKVDIYSSLLAKLSILSPFFAKQLLDQAIENSGKTHAEMRPVDYLEIINNDIQEKFSSTIGQKSVLLAGAGLVITGKNRNLTYMNSYARKILSYLSSAAADKDPFELFEARGFVRDIPNMTDLDVVRIRLPEARRNYNVSLAPLFNEKGIILGCVSVIQDITLSQALETDTIRQSNELRTQIQQRLETEEALIQSERLASMGVMAGGIGHEINNPLTGIILSLQVLKGKLEKGHADNELIFEKLNSALSMAMRINKIVKGMSRLLSGGTGNTNSLSYCSIQQVFEDVSAICFERFKASGINLNVQFPIKDYSIRLNETELGQVLINLLNNSFDAIADLDEKWIKLECKLKRNNLEIAVIDSGFGLSPEVRSKLFMPFFTTKKVGQGTGLGLSLSKRIVKAAGGELIYDSTCPNTCFRFTLPLGDQVGQ